MVTGFHRVVTDADLLQQRSSPVTFPRRRLANLSGYDLVGAWVRLAYSYARSRAVCSELGIATLFNGRVSRPILVGILLQAAAISHPPSHPLFWGLWVLVCPSSCCLLPLFQLLVHRFLRGHGCQVVGGQGTTWVNSQTLLQVEDDFVAYPIRLLEVAKDRTTILILFRLDETISTRSSPRCTFPLHKWKLLSGALRSSIEDHPSPLVRTSSPTDLGRELGSTAQVSGRFHLCFMMGFFVLPNTLAGFFGVFPSLLFSGSVSLGDVVSFVRVFWCAGTRLRELRLVARPDVCKRPWSLREPRAWRALRWCVHSWPGCMHVFRDWEHAETVRRRCPSAQLEALRLHGPRVTCG